MNALINDQVKRLREIFVDSDITFGVYNGNTEQTEKAGQLKYRTTYGFEPMPNERVSRDAMREKPPHILITNYSMLEYMCIRPDDDNVFRNAKLRFVVLDEAHIYKGATGIEASMLVRRVETRLTEEGHTRSIFLQVPPSVTRVATHKFSPLAKGSADMAFKPLSDRKR